MPMDAVSPESVEWLWRQRIPLGMLTLLMGDPGLGKSHLSLYVAAKVSVGGAFPDGATAPKGATVLLTAEDGLAMTVQPRLCSYGADLRRITALTGVRPYDESGDVCAPDRSFRVLEDVYRLQDVVCEAGAQLVIIDPVNAYLAGIDAHKAAEVRGALAPLASMAEATGAAVLVICHLNKSPGSNALYRASGSLDFVAAARSVLGVAEDPESDGRRALLPIKLNIAARPEGLGYSITDDGVVFDFEPVTMDAAGAFGVRQRAESEPMGEAKEFLSRVLASGSPYPSKAIFEEAESQGIKQRTLFRAKKALGIKASRQGGLGNEGSWSWRLPAAADDVADDDEGEPAW